jgi:hypothetical protein
MNVVRELIEFIKDKGKGVTKSNGGLIWPCRPNGMEAGKGSRELALCFKGF